MAQLPGCPIPRNIGFTSASVVGQAGESFAKNNRDSQAKNIINSYRYFRLACLQTSLGRLRQAKLPKNVLISARLKRLRSISRKLQRSPRGALNRMDDIIGFRVICGSLREMRELVANLEHKLNAKIRNYIDNTHKNEIGYRAIHVIDKFKQPLSDEHCITVRFEIQVRTWKQHRWACECEQYGESAKEGFVGRKDEEAEDIKDKLRHESDEIKQWEEKHADEIQKKDMPVFQGEQQLMIARSIPSPSGASFASDFYDNDISSVKFWLNYYEDNYPEQKVLLLVGYGNEQSQGLKRLLRETHPNFFYLSKPP